MLKTHDKKVLYRHQKTSLIQFYKCHMYLQGSRLKKSSGRLLVTNWRNIVGSCTFLVATLYNVNDAAHSQDFWSFAQSRNSQKHTKYSEIQYKS